jgi:hypothetical protein
MRTVHTIALAELLQSAMTWAADRAAIHLRLGDRTTMRVGETAVLRLSSIHPYTVTVDGDAVSPAGERDDRTHVYSYRAVHAGKATLLITPANRKLGECVDCATRHCFIT